jgi:hypothetical protein
MIELFQKIELPEFVVKVKSAKCWYFLYKLTTESISSVQLINLYPDKFYSDPSLLFQKIKIVRIEPLEV